MAARERAEGLTGPDFQQEAVLLLQEALQAFGKAHRAADLPRPVPRVDRVGCTDPVSGDVRDTRNARLARPGAGDPVRERSKHRLHHPRMECMRRVEAMAFHACRREPLLQLLYGGRGSRHHAGRRFVDRRDVELVVERASKVPLRHRNRKHRSGRKRLHQATALGDEGESVLEGEHAREAGRDELSDAVPDHRVGHDAPLHPQERERVLDREQRRLGEPRLHELRGGGLGAALRGIQEIAQIDRDMRLERLRATVERHSERGLDLIEISGHVDVLRALAGEHEYDGPASRWLGCREKPSGRPSPEHVDQVSPIPEHDGLAVGKSPASDLRGIGEIVRAHVVRALEVVRQIRRRHLQRRPASCRKQ